MNDINNFRNLVKAVYPSLNASVSIELPEDGHHVAVAAYKVRLTGSILFVPVEVSKDSATAALAALKVPVAKSRREKDARAVLSECVRRASGHLTDEQREAILSELMDCRYAEYEARAASCLSRAVEIGRANLDSEHYQLAHS